MTPGEAKLHLAGYRPELYADDDPQVAEALALAKSDPELWEWLEGEIAFDCEMASMLGDVEPPAGAREQLLVAAVGQRDRRLDRRRMWLAAAAVFVLLAAGAVKYFMFPPPVDFAAGGAKTVATFRDQMALFANERFMLDKFYKDLGESQQFLEKEGYPVFPKVPDRFVGYRGMGCKTIDWDGTKVGLVCFKNGSGDVVHIFVVEAADLDELTRPATPLEQIAVVRGLETGGWAAGDKVMLLVGADPGVPVGEFL